MTKPRSEFVVFKAADGWRWNLKASNGEILCQSEAYTRRADAERGADDARTAAMGAAVRVEE